MERRVVHVQLPVVLADKLDRLAASDGATTSEIVRQALRQYLSARFEQAANDVSRIIRPLLEADGVNEDNVEQWYKKTRKQAKDKVAS